MNQQPRQIDLDAEALVKILDQQGEEAFRTAFRTMIQERRLKVWEACCLEERCRSVFERTRKKKGAP